MDSQNDGKIIIAGAFTTYDGISRKYVARLNGTGEGTAGVNDIITKNITAVYPNPTNNVLNIEVSENMNIKIVNALGTVVATQKLNAGNNSIDVRNLTNGVYVISNGKGDVVKFIRE